MEFQNSSVSKAHFLEFQKYGLFLLQSRFMEFHLYGIFDQFSNLLNSKNRHYFQIVRLLEFLFKLLIQARNDVWSVESMDLKGKVKSQNFKSLFSFNLKVMILGQN